MGGAALGGLCGSGQERHHLGQANVAAHGP
jgi:hypothetical protein